ncbi:hypothetical protein EVAR_59783_1 [Eumeta japonica]|uniref:Uncharacterized protein n=1 Tax=Eumeta variegata TaxID=151549 RepID=A0A4C1YFZ5_EUMVA|nr:hypothetical protein EVAR_59783_1 [Eumeta japonica]
MRASERHASLPLGMQKLGPADEVDSGAAIKSMSYLRAPAATQLVGYEGLLSAFSARTEIDALSPINHLFFPLPIPQALFTSPEVGEEESTLDVVFQEAARSAGGSAEGRRPAAARAGGPTLLINFNALT